MLCMNRPEGFGPSSTISSPLPTQCFFDVVLVPLPAWLYFAVLLVLGAVSTLSGRGRRSTRAVPRPLLLQARPRPIRRWLRIATLVLYYFFIAVVVLMHTVEVAQLAKIGYGIGLLPFVYAGCVVAVGMQATKGIRGAIRGWQVANCVFWVGGFVMAVIKVVAVVRMGTTGPFAREDGPYSTPHQITDLAILAAFYALTLAVEVGLMFQAPGQRGHKGERVAYEGENKNMVV